MNVQALGSIATAAGGMPQDGAGRFAGVAAVRFCGRRYSSDDHSKPAGLRIRPVALFLALGIHAAAGILVTASGSEYDADAAITASAKVVSVRLGGAAETAGEATGYPAAGQPELGRLQKTRKLEKPAVAIAQPTGPHYFRMSELTRKPVLLHDAVADLILRVSGLPPQPVILRLLISDEGRIDHVVVEDSFLAADIEHEVIQAFANLRFEPGRIGRIAVRSQMRVEARLENMEYRLPETPGLPLPGSHPG